MAIDWVEIKCDRCKVEEIRITALLLARMRRELQPVLCEDCEDEIYYADEA